MVDYSIEYAHTYVDEAFSEEHIKILEKLKRILDGLVDEGSTYSLNILIDDYNPSENTLDIEEFLEKIGEYGLQPDFVVLESELIKSCEELFQMMPDNKVKRSYKKYIKEKNHYPCSLLVAVWYFLRLGLLESENMFFVRKNQDKSFSAKGLINVLQERYKEPENKAFEIIKNSDCPEKLYNIEEVFI